MPKAATKQSTAAAAAKSKSKSPFSINRFLLSTIGCVFCAVLGMEYEKRNQLSIGSFAKELKKGAAVETVMEYPKIAFSKEQPIFSLSLPNTGMTILPRYFECAGHYDTFGRYWTAFSPQDNNRRPIGKCIQNNLEKTGNNILEGCGDFDVWHDMQYREATSPVNPEDPSHCFDPVVFPGSLERLYNSKPNATVVIQIKDPAQWYKTLSYDLHDHWNEWCNPTHRNAFPTEHTEVAYLKFYEDYHQKIRDFVQTHPGWTLIELDLAQTSPAAIGRRLQQQLGIDSHCWKDSVQGNIPLYNNDTASGAMTASLPRPNDITYPILVVGLPKSGTSTTHMYFECNLGKFMAAHQWTHQNLPPYDGISIGECMQNNIRQKLPALHNCGNPRVFSDIGIFDTRKQQCFYPSIHGGLQRFAEAYPYATVMLAVRSAKSWVKSIEKWANLKERWAHGQEQACPGTFPPEQSDAQLWVEFYNNHTQSIRDFVMGHPTLTYIEVPLTDDTGPIMNNVFGYHKACWGHHNVFRPDAPSFGGNKIAPGRA